jgi:uncharacterized repeat protein (TIGR02543 family)
MNKFLQLILAILMLCVSYSVFAEGYTLTLEDVDFDTTTGTINGFYGDIGTEIVIPGSFNVDGNDVDVISIGKGAFSLSSLTDLTISEGITTIGDSAFQHNSISELILPSTVTSIGALAFSNNLLTSLTLSSNVTSLGMFAFSDNELTDIIIPTSITEMGDGAFNKNLIIKINGVSSNGLIYDRNEDGSEDLSKIVSYGGVSEVIDFIPEGVSVIGDRAFAYNTITSIIIPEGIVSIGVLAFYRNNLTSLSIPESVTSIGDRAFANNQIAALILPESIINFGVAVFNNNAITMVNNEESQGLIYGQNEDGSEDASVIVSYGGSASVVDFIPESVRSIKENAFYFCSLSSVTIPENVTTIEEMAFYLNNLSEVIFNEGLIYIEQRAFYRNNLSKVTLPVSLISIGEEAFDDNSMTSFLLPGQNTYLNDYIWIDNESNTYQYNEEVTDLTSDYVIDGAFGIIYELDGGNNNINNPNAYLSVDGVSSFYPGSKDGYNFVGWYSDEDLITEISSIAQGSTDDIVLWAKWDVSTDVSEVNATELTLYPNPVIDQLTIDFKDEAIWTIYIYAANGQLLRVKSCQATQTLVDMSNYASGLYIIKVSDGTKQKIYKIIKR